MRLFLEASTIPQVLQMFSDHAGLPLNAISIGCYGFHRYMNSCWHCTSAVLNTALVTFSNLFFFCRSTRDVYHNLLHHSENKECFVYCIDIYIFSLQ
jgi:hypothetical protein